MNGHEGSCPPGAAGGQDRRAEGQGEELSSGGPRAALRRGCTRSWAQLAQRRLGHGGDATERVPRRVAALAAVAVAAVAAGANHTSALGEGGGVYAFGSNASGQLGDGALADAAAPRRVQMEAPAAARESPRATCTAPLWIAAAASGDRPRAPLLPASLGFHIVRS